MKTTGLEDGANAPVPATPGDAGARPRTYTGFDLPPTWNENR